MKRFHTILNHNQIIDPDFRTLGGGEISQLKNLFHQVLDRISIFCLVMFVDNDLIFHL